MAGVIRAREPLALAAVRMAAESPAVRWIGVPALFGAALWAGTAYPVQRQLAAVTAVLALTGAVGALLWQERTPVHGLALLLGLAVLAPIGVRGQWDICLPLAAVLCLSWAVRPFLWRRPIGLEWSPAVVASLVFVVSAILSFLVGQFDWFPTDPAPRRAQVGGLALFVVSGGLFLVVGHQVRQMAHLRWLTWLFIGVGGLFVVSEFMPALPGLRTLQAMTNPRTVGSLFWVWLVAMSLSQALVNRELSPTVRALLLVVAMLGLMRGPLLALSWASGWIPAGVAAGVILFLRYPRLTVAGGLLAAAPILLFLGNLVDVLMERESYSLMTRLEAWALILRIVEGNPWLGYGPANYHHYTVLFPIRGWWVRFNSHSNYLDLLAQTGIVGLLAFSWFAFEAARLSARLWRRLGDGFARAYGTGALAGLAGSLVAGLLGDWIVPFIYNVGVQGFRSSLLFWFFLGGVLALHRLTMVSGVGADDSAARTAAAPGWTPDAVAPSGAAVSMRRMRAARQPG